MAADTERAPKVPARDAAIAVLAKATGLEPGDAGALVDLLVLAAVHEAGQRVADSIVEPLLAAAKRHCEGFSAMLERSAQEMRGERG